MIDRDIVLVSSYQQSMPECGVTREARCRHCQGLLARQETEDECREAARESGHLCSQLEQIELLRAIKANLSRIEASR